MTTAIKHYTCKDTGMTVYARGNGWEDEDGIARDPKEERRARRAKERAERKAKREAALKASAEAAKKAMSDFGFKALKGTKKQRDWAEEIRRDIISRVSDEAKVEFLDEQYQDASFWINNRHLSPRDISEWKFADDNIAAEQKAALESGDLNQVLQLKHRRNAVSIFKS